MRYILILFATTILISCGQDKEGAEKFLYSSLDSNLSNISLPANFTISNDEYGSLIMGKREKNNKISRKTYLDSNITFKGYQWFLEEQLFAIQSLENEGITTTYIDSLFLKSNTMIEAIDQINLHVNKISSTDYYLKIDYPIDLVDYSYSGGNLLIKRDINNGIFLFRKEYPAQDTINFTLIFRDTPKEGKAKSRKLLF